MAEVRDPRSLPIVVQRINNALLERAQLVREDCDSDPFNSSAETDALQKGGVSQWDLGFTSNKRPREFSQPSKPNVYTKKLKREGKTRVPTTTVRQP